MSEGRGPGAWIRGTSLGGSKTPVEYIAPKPPLTWVLYAVRSLKGDYGRVVLGPDDVLKGPLLVGNLGEQEGRFDSGALHATQQHGLHSKIRRRHVLADASSEVSWVPGRGGVPGGGGGGGG